MKLKISYILVFFFVFLIFQNYALVLTSTLTAVDIWLKRVFPFLFIMFVVNDILINLNFASFFPKTTPYIFIMSLLSGAPSNAFIIASLVQRKTITAHNGNLLLMCTYFANPLFLYSFLQQLFSFKIALKLILIHYLANLGIYFFIHKQIKSQSFSVQNSVTFNLGQSITKSMSLLTMILGTITFFMIVTNILAQTCNFNIFFTTILKGLFEVTQGLNNLLTLNLNLKLKEIIASLFISFGGLSIHSQVKCLLDNENLKYSFFFKGRIFQALIAIILTFLT